MCLSTYLHVVYLFFYDNRALPQTPIECVENQPTPKLDKEPKKSRRASVCSKIHLYIILLSLSDSCLCCCVISEESSVWVTV